MSKLPNRPQHYVAGRTVSKAERATWIPLDTRTRVVLEAQCCDCTWGRVYDSAAVPTEPGTRPLVGESARMHAKAHQHRVVYSYRKLSEYRGASYPKDRWKKPK